MKEIVDKIDMINSNKRDLRSKKDCNLLGKVSPTVRGWGTTIVVAITLILLIVVCFVPYPNSNGESIIQHIILTLFRWMVD